MSTPIPGLSGHAVYLLMIQLALLVAAARAGAELAKRVGMPAVVGELGAGIALGPSLFGHYFPGAFAVIFPPDPRQFHLLDAFGSVGMTLLLLLTGLETDVRLLRNLGRAALIASVMGMVLPFALGFGLGYVMPVHYLTDPNGRILFSVFLATAMSISAMPVIAKILVDLDLTKRNLGLVILSAGVVDDTVGWLILSLIAGAATHGAVNVEDLGVTVALLAGFILAVILVLFPFLRFAVRMTTEHFKVQDSDLVLVIVTTFLCAAATERIGIHPVFGAFVAGIVLHQTPRLRRETVARLESFTFGVLAPIFFGIVGLRVNLWELGDGKMLGIVIAVACVGKLLGAYLGASWGGLRFWEAASIAVAMNARGAMEIVVATIGLNLGILTPAMFSIIVMVAIVTSFLAPVGLKLTMPRVRMTEDEARRILASESTGAFDPGHVRVLLASGGGDNALAAAPVAFGLASKSDAAVKILHVSAKTSVWQRLMHPFRHRTTGSGSVTEQLEVFRAFSEGKPPEIVRTNGASIVRAICEEAKRGADIIVIGSGEGPSIGGAVVEELVGEAPCHVAIMKARGPSDGYHRILVPVDGSVASRLAVELALRYAEATGASLALAVMTERRPQAAAYADISGTHVTVEVRATSDEELQRISVAFRASEVKPNILHLAFDPRSSAVVDELERGKYDLVVLGAENRAIQHRLFFGYENERLIRATRVPVVVVVPNLGRLAAGHSGH